MVRKARRDKVLSLVFCGALRIGEKAFARLAPVAQRLHWRTQRQSLPRSQRVAMSHRIAELERQLSSPNNSATPMDRGERPLSTPSRPTAQVPSVRFHPLVPTIKAAEALVNNFWPNICTKTPGCIDKRMQRGLWTASGSGYALLSFPQ